jgi:hypothetical protein
VQLGREDKARLGDTGPGWAAPGRLSHGCLACSCPSVDKQLLELPIVDGGQTGSSYLPVALSGDDPARTRP